MMRGADSGNAGVRRHAVHFRLRFSPNCGDLEVPVTRIFRNVPTPSFSNNRSTGLSTSLFHPVFIWERVASKATGLRNPRCRYRGYSLRSYRDLPPEYRTIAGRSGSTRFPDERHRALESVQPGSALPRLSGPAAECLFSSERQASVHIRLSVHRQEEHVPQIAGRDPHVQADRGDSCRSAVTRYWLA